MTHRRLLISGAIIAFVILIAFALSVPHTRDLGFKRPTALIVATTPVVTLRDTYKKGVHTLTGSVIVPNACAHVSIAASQSGASSTPSIALALTYPADVGVCLQMPTKMSFQTTIAGAAGLPLVVTVNGSIASTTSK